MMKVPVEPYSYYPMSYAAPLQGPLDDYSSENMQVYDPETGTYMQYASVPADFVGPDHSAQPDHLAGPVNSSVEYGYAYTYEHPAADTMPPSLSPARPVPISSFSTLDHPSHRVVNQVESGHDRAQQVDHGQPITHEVIAHTPLLRPRYK